MLPIIILPSVKRILANASTYGAKDGFQAFINTLKYYIDLAFSNRRHKKTWITTGIIISLKRLKELYHSAISSKNVEDFDYYRKYKQGGNVRRNIHDKTD